MDEFWLVAFFRGGSVRGGSFTAMYFSFLVVWECFNRFYYINKEALFPTKKNNSTMHMYGYVYRNNFTLLDISLNRIETINGIGCNNQFQRSFDYQMNSSLIWIVTTDKENEQGNFSIIINGRNNVIMKRKGKLSFYSLLARTFIYL